MAPPVKGYSRTPTAGNPARTEAWALLESARAIEAGKEQGRDALLAALRRNWRLWTIFQASLVDADCQMPLEPRRNLLRLANFVDRRTAQLLADPQPSQADELVNINRQIGEGLLEGARNAAAAAKAQAPTSTTLRESA
jgi:flagellar biosynthesis activator protein FlaF